MPFSTSPAEFRTSITPSSSKQSHGPSSVDARVFAVRSYYCDVTARSR